jgi:hypothetical protein
MPFNTHKKSPVHVLGFFVDQSSSPNHHAAIGHNGLAGNVLASSAGQ